MGTKADLSEAAQALFDDAMKPRPGERVFTLRHHVADGWLAMAHCSWCGSSFISIGANDVEGKAGQGWQRTSNVAVTTSRENLADHEKHCWKKPEVK